MGLARRLAEIATQREYSDAVAPDPVSCQHRTDQIGRAHV